AGSEAQTYQALRDYVQGLHAGGGTAIYSSLYAAYQLAKQEFSSDRDRVITVVLLTDGENNKGVSYDQFRARFLELQAETNMEVRTFPILFGEASSDELEEIARMTGGRAFDGRHTNLGSVFKEIR